MNAILRYGFATLAFVGLMTGPVLATAAPAQTPATLFVEDSAKFFSESAKEKAKSIIASAMGAGNRQVHLETYEALSTEERASYDKKDSDKKKFWEEWGKTKARGDRGILIAICKSPGGIEVLVDSQFRDHGFSADKRAKLMTIFMDALPKAAKVAKDKTDKSEKEAMDIRDAALISAAEFLKADMPTTLLTPAKDKNANKEQTKADGGGSNLQKYLCIGICVLLGGWLIMGLIRAFSGGGGGGSGGPGGGGGGGGFMSGMMGGLFGAMAGMWLYNNVFGGGMSSAMGDSGSNMSDGGGTESGGAGDFSGDAGSGGDFGGDSGGGGDYGGGGGDYGGGDF